MGLLYNIIIGYFRLALNVFYRQILVTGLENVPKDAPLIFAGNHYNGLLDPLLVMSTCGRAPVRTMGKATLFNLPIIGCLAKAVGAVPVHRAQDSGKGEKRDNSNAFSTVEKVLADGGAFSIFPEGISHDKTQLQKLRTGAARIALGVVQNQKKPIDIVVVGLNYVKRDRFRSSVVIAYSPPIRVGKEWLPLQEQDSFLAAKSLTRVIEERMHDMIIEAPDWDTLMTIHTARRIYRPEKMTSVHEWMLLTQRFAEGYRANADKAEVRELKHNLDLYQRRLEGIRVHDSQLATPPGIFTGIWKLFKAILFTVIMLPIALVGILLHSPIILLSFLAGKSEKELDVISTKKLLVASILTPLLYIGLVVAVASTQDSYPLPTAVETYRGYLWVLALLALPIIAWVTVRVAEVLASVGGSSLSVIRLLTYRTEFKALVKFRANLRTHLLKVIDLYHTGPRLFIDGIEANPEADLSPIGLLNEEAAASNALPLSKSVSKKSLAAVHIDPALVIKSGHLTKEGGEVKSKKKRFFVLTRSALRYFDDDSVLSKEVEPKGGFSLLDIKKAQKVGDDADGDTGFRFEVSVESADQNRTYVMWASSADEREDWLISLMARTLTTPRPG